MYSGVVRELESDAIAGPHHAPAARRCHRRAAVELAIRGFARPRTGAQAARDARRRRRRGRTRDSRAPQPLCTVRLRRSHAYFFFVKAGPNSGLIWQFWNRPTHIRVELEALMIPRREIDPARRRHEPAEPRLERGVDPGSGCAAPLDCRLVRPQRSGRVAVEVRDRPLEDASRRARLCPNRVRLGEERPRRGEERVDDRAVHVAAGSPGGTAERRWRRSGRAVGTAAAA